MIKNKHLLQFVSVLLIATLLTFTAGRVTRVKAMATGAAVAVGVAVIVGTAFLGYLALTGATITYPDTVSRNDYVARVGEWVMEYGSGVGIMKLISQATDWVGRQALSALDFTVEYTSELISDFYNTFNNINLIQSSIAVSVPPNLTVPSLNFPYSIPTYNTIYELKYWDNSLDYVQEILPGYALYLCASGMFSTVNRFQLMQFPYTNLVNYQIQGSTDFYIGTLVGNTITRVSKSIKGYSPLLVYQQGTLIGSASYTMYNREVWLDGRVDRLQPFSVPDDYSAIPLLANKPLYLVNSSGEIISTSADVVSTSSTSVSFPDYGGSDDDNNPIIPFVVFPKSPTTPNGFWGSLVDDILDAVENGLDAAILAELFNAFADSFGGDSITYDDDNINYYYLYDIKNNIVQQSEQIPIDLNEISLYTDNRFLDAVTDSISSVSDSLHDYVAFWYDIDPTVVLVVLGSAVLSVVALLLHKMGG